MKSNSNKKLRVIGFDDAPFHKHQDEKVNISGIVCSNTRFEGMLWGTVKRDGIDATSVLTQLILDSKFHPQLHAVLIDGLAFGGFNLVDLPLLSSQLELPCIAVMRRKPNLEKIKSALQIFSDREERIRKIQAAGEVFYSAPFYFQVIGCNQSEAENILNKVTDTGNVPEPLRLAHLIGSAIKTGQSGNRA